MDGDAIGRRGGIGLASGLVGVAVLVNPVAGPAALVVLSAATGDYRGVHVLAAGASLAALAYLILFGSILAYSTYEWLAQRAPARLLGTYAFVNPVVAVALGWLLLGEDVGLRTGIAAAVIAAGVALIVTQPDPAAAPADEREREPASRTSRAGR